MSSPSIRAISHRKSSAFTLVELLVAFLIVAVLAILTFSVTSKISGGAKTAKCSSNLRQIGIALNLYLNEHANSFPPHLGPNPAGGPYLAWYGFLAPYLMEGASSEGPIATHQMAPVFHCPANPNPQQGLTYESSGANMDNQSYGYNFWWVTPYPGKEHWGNPVHKRLEIKHPHLWVVMADIATTGVSDDMVPFHPAMHTNTLYPGRGVTQRHQGSANVLFVDGHVETRNSKLLQSNEFDLRNWDPDQD